MYGRRRALVAVLATAFSVLAFGEPSSTGVVVATPHAKAIAAKEPPSVGTTVLASAANNGRQFAAGGITSMMSGNGRYTVFETIAPGGQSNIFVRDLENSTTSQISVTTAGGQPNGNSIEPSISGSGRFVSFITFATDIGTGALATGVPETLVVCDRGSPPFTGTPQCGRIVSTSVNTNERLAVNDRPRLSGTGNAITFTVSSTAEFTPPSSLLVIGLSTANGAPSASGTPTTVTGGLPTGTQYLHPVLDNFAGDVVYVARTIETSGTTIRLMRTDINAPDTGIRLDVDPQDPTHCVAADESGCLGNPVSGLDKQIDDPSVSDNGTHVAFHFHQDAAVVIPFRPPLAALAPTGAVDWELVANVAPSTDAVTTKVISLDNAGNPVDGTDGAISGDGRFVAFVTDAPGAHDGTDAGCTSSAPIVCAPQIVLRDLQRDPNGGTLKGALATPSCTTSPCDPPYTASVNPGPIAAFGDIFIDAIGSRISFDSTDNELVPGDANTGTNPPTPDTFVRTWQPAALIDPLDGSSCATADSCAFDVGSTQPGTSIEMNVPVTVRGFGPLTFSGTATQFATITDGSNPGDFAVISSTCSGLSQLYSGDVCYVEVKFTPSGPGTRSATLSMQADQVGSPRSAGTVQGTAGPALTVAPGDTTRTSLTDSGGQAGSPLTFQLGGNQSMISGNGRWDVFVSEAALDPSIGNGDGGQYQGGTENIFVRDLANPQHTVQISQTGSPDSTDPTKFHTTGQAPDLFSFAPSISDDGRFVSFVTSAENIVGDTGFTQALVVCDRDPNSTGVLDQGPYACFLVPADDVPQQGFGAPRLSGDGTKITWSGSFTCFDCIAPVEVSTLTNTPGGALRTPTTPVRVPIIGVSGFRLGTSNQYNPVLTRDGSKVVFTACNGSNFCSPNAVIATTLATPTRRASSVRLDVDPTDPTKFLGGQGWFISDPPATSADGTRVAFAAANRTASLVFVDEVSGNKVNRTVVESRDNSGRPGAGYFPALSGDGHYLAFLTDTSNMHDGVDNLGSGGCEPSEIGFAAAVTPSVFIACQVVARDLSSDLATGGDPWVPSELVSSSLTNDCQPAVPLPPGRPCAGDADSTNPSIDATGSEIGFDSSADDLIADASGTLIDTNRAIDSFVHTWRPTLTAPDVNFGSVPLGGHAKRTLTLTEQPVGVDHIFGPISPGSTPITGANAGDYTVTASTCGGRTLNPGAGENSCTVTIRFTPSATGARNATIAVNTGKNGFPRQDPHVTAALTGVGTAVLIPHLTTDPTTLDFGKRLPEAPGLTKTVTVTDSGTGSVDITDVSAKDTNHPGASGDYTVDATDCLKVLLPGESCTVKVTFVGHRVGVRDAELVITDDDPSGPTTVLLEAKVPKPQIIANPGVAAPGQVTIISGTGFAPKRDVIVSLRGSSETVTVRADKKGTFDVGLVLFRSVPLGPRVVDAHSDGVSPTISANGPLLVALGSVDILQLVTRH